MSCEKNNPNFESLVFNTSSRFAQHWWSFRFTTAISQGENKQTKPALGKQFPTPPLAQLFISHSHRKQQHQNSEQVCKVLRADLWWVFESPPCDPSHRLGKAGCVSSHPEHPPVLCAPAAASLCWRGQKGQQRAMLEEDSSRERETTTPWALEGHR